MREILVTQFRTLGIEPATAKTGLDALAQAARGRPDLIVLDGLLPEMHGFEVARAVRNLDPDYKPRIAIITGIYKSTQYQNEARTRYGIDDYLLKPVSTDSLRKLLSFPQK